MLHEASVPSSLSGYLVTSKGIEQRICVRDPFKNVDKDCWEIGTEFENWEVMIFKTEKIEWLLPKIL